MTSAKYLDNFFESVDHLPFELKRNLLLLAELDERSQSQLIEADESADQLLADLTAEPVNDDTKVELISNIKRAYKTAKYLAEDKVQLANQSYELVDQYIRRLDAHMSQFKEDIADSLSERNIPIPDELRDFGVGVSAKNYLNITKQNVKYFVRRKVSVSSIEGESDEELKEYKMELFKGQLSDCEKKMEAVSIEDNVEPFPVSNAADMPVLPNEPIFCFCDNVAYSDMVACDNEHCKIEWFHFECVGLLGKPNGKWYCDQCSIKN